MNKGFIINKRGSHSHSQSMVMVNKLRNLLTVARQELKTIELAYRNIVS